MVAGQAIKLYPLIKRMPKLVFKSQKMLIGWQEWCTLPGLKVPLIKAKIDTGAKTSSLHVFDLQPFHKNYQQWVRFVVHPLQRNSKLSLIRRARVVDERMVMSSNGHKELRYVIKTPLTLGNLSWDIEVTLSNRDPLAFRMLLGREALKSRVIIDPTKALCQGKIKSAKLRAIYRKLNKSEGE